MQHAEYFRQFLIDEVNLDDTRLSKLDARVQSVYGALCDDIEIGDVVRGKSKQGSWAHQLIIRPKTGGEFDADFLLDMQLQDGWQPTRYIDEVYNARLSYLTNALYLVAP